MNISRFISNKIQHRENKSFSGTVSVVGIISIAISIAAMIISFAILRGFQETIREKLFSFGGHIQVTQYSLNNSFEDSPISLNTELYKNVEKKVSGIKNIQQYSQKAGLLKTDDDLQGVMFKGIGQDFDTTTFEQNLIKGHFIQLSDTAETRQIIVSQVIASKLKLKVGDTLIIYFIQDPPKARRVSVAGIYESNMEEFDENIILGDIRLLRSITGWADTLTGGYEIHLKNFADIEKATAQIEALGDYDMDILPVTQKFKNVFEWLDLLNRNVFIFILLILVVASFNMISVLLILIMERTRMIGLLKAMGATYKQIRDIFLWNAAGLIIKGLAWGNLTGISFCAIQHYTHFIPLDHQTYYMSFVPISFPWFIFIGLNVVASMIILAVLILPTVIISRIQPVKAIRFD
jgi:lipoprotein-releasing system permease protein